MKRTFADTSFWVATLYKRDQHYAQARVAMARLRKAQIVTSELVVAEVLDHGWTNPNSRSNAGQWAASIWLTFGVLVVPQTKDLFDRALRLYNERHDKQWSFTDCTSMVLMHELKITDALTADHHFEQAGFNILLK